MNAAIRNIVHRVIVSRAGLTPLVKWLSTRATPDVDVFEPQGVHFRAPAGARGMLVSPAGATEVGAVVGLGGAPPDEGEGMSPGEGGLHYLGTWQIYLSDTGQLHLGGGRGDGDLVALSSLCATELQDLSDRIAVFERIFAAWTPVILDGGGALKTLYSADPGTPGPAPGSVAATKVQAV